MWHFVGNVADVCSILGVPGVFITLWQVYRLRREHVDARERSQWGDMVKFIDTDLDIDCIVSFAKMTFLPRIGDKVTACVAPDGPTCHEYRVADVHFICLGDEKENGASRLVNVRVDLKRVVAARGLSS